MKLIIDIPENLYQEIIDNADEIQENGCVFDREIINGISIPDNATNGDVIKTMFPNVDFCQEYADLIRKIEKINVDSIFIVADFVKPWWNAPYQKGGK